METAHTALDTQLLSNQQWRVHYEVPPQTTQTTASIHVTKRHKQRHNVAILLGVLSFYIIPTTLWISSYFCYIYIYITF